MLTEEKHALQAARASKDARTAWRETLAWALAHARVTNRPDPAFMAGLSDDEERRIRALAASFAGYIKRGGAPPPPRNTAARQRAANEEAARERAAEWAARVNEGRAALIRERGGTIPPGGLGLPPIRRKRA